jgi:hypothetical protein
MVFFTWTINFIGWWMKKELLWLVMAMDEEENGWMLDFWVLV